MRLAVEPYPVTNWDMPHLSSATFTNSLLNGGDVLHPAYQPFNFANPPTIWGQQLFKQWAKIRNGCSNSLLQCHFDLLDTAYPSCVIDFWIATFLKEGRCDWGDQHDSATLRRALEDIQNRVNNVRNPSTVTL